MHRNLRLAFLKLLFNVPMRLLDRLLPEPPEPTFPQTEMLGHVYETMMKVYKLEVIQGRFSKYDGENPDGNFERFLRVSHKVASRICEEDRYYRQWVGFAFTLAAKELEGMDKSPENLKKQIRQQWMLDLDFLPFYVFNLNREEFAETALCYCLGNLARMEVGKAHFPGNVETKMEVCD